MVFKGEYDSHVSMHHTDAAGVMYVGAPIGWAQVGRENLFRAAGHPIESLKRAAVHITAPDGAVHVSIELTGVAQGRDGSKPRVEDWIRDLHAAAREHGLGEGRRR